MIVLVGAYLHPKGFLRFFSPNKSFSSPPSAYPIALASAVMKIGAVL
jgi:hypothetical protein